MINQTEEQAPTRHRGRKSTAFRQEKEKVEAGVPLKNLNCAGAVWTLTDT